MKKLTVILTLFTITTLVFSTVTADVAIRDLRKAYNSISSFSGSITIRIGNKVFSGKIKYKVPNKIKINFFQPSAIDLVSDGSSIWIYIKGNNTVIKQPILAKRNDRIIYASEIINPYERYNKEYIIVLDNVNEKAYSFTLRSKPDVFSTFSSAKLVAFKNGLISSISGITATRENVSIELKYDTVNNEIDDREFFFTPPADAQVLTDIFQE